MGPFLESEKDTTKFRGRTKRGWGGGGMWKEDYTSQWEEPPNHMVIGVAIERGADH